MVRDTSAQVVAWSALIIAIIALALSWVAYNRAGEDIGEQVQQELVDARQEISQELAVLEARTRLAALRADIAAGQAYAESAQEVQEIRTDLRNAYSQASAETRAQWQEVDADLEVLEQDLRDESADAVNSLENALAALEQDLRTDEN